MTRKALLIANGAFDDHRIASLKSPVSDLDRLGKLLSRENVGGYDVAWCSNLTLVALRIRILSFFRDAALDDTLFVMLSGHGIKDSDGKLHFATKDSNFDAIDASALEARFLHDQMDRSPACKKILFLDTCYSGAFGREAGGSKSLVQPVTKDEFGDSESRGKVVVTASTAVQVAIETIDGDVCQSRFTRHLIDGIETGRADRFAKGGITVDEIYDYIRDQIRKEADETPGAKPQTPQRWYFGLEGSVLFVRNPVPKPMDISAEVLQLLSSSSSTDRALGVEKLDRLARADDRLKPIVIKKLREMRGDDSVIVDAAVRISLKRHTALEAENQPVELLLGERGIKRRKSLSALFQGRIRSNSIIAAILAVALTCLVAVGPSVKEFLSGRFKNDQRSSDPSARNSDVAGPMPKMANAISRPAVREKHAAPPAPIVKPNVDKTVTYEPGTDHKPSEGPLARNHPVTTGAVAYEAIPKSVAIQPSYILSGKGSCDVGSSSPTEWKSKYIPSNDTDTAGYFAVFIYTFDSGMYNGDPINKAELEWQNKLSSQNIYPVALLGAGDDYRRFGMAVAIVKTKKQADAVMRIMQSCGIAKSPYIRLIR